MELELPVVCNSVQQQDVIAVVELWLVTQYVLKNVQFHCIAQFSKLRKTFPKFVVRFSYR